MGKYKKNKPKREKKPQRHRTKEERQDEVKVILQKLNDLQLNPLYPPIQQLYIKCKEYIEKSERIELNIPFPEIHRCIKGVLAISIREEVWINLKNTNDKSRVDM